MAIVAAIIPVTVRQLTWLNTKAIESLFAVITVNVAGKFLKSV
jgi:hypothetical protein